jgi:hypothetical protein
MASTTNYEHVAVLVEAGDTSKDVLAAQGAQVQE